MQGRRINNDEDKLGEPGDYWYRADLGKWFVCTPNGMYGGLGNHTVTEHEDGTITVSPSILTTQNYANGSTHEWHGYLERGVWREV